MREIKFRGKDIKNGEWVYGDLHLLCNAPHIHTLKSMYPYAGIRSFVNEETIGQFTGLEDKNGKEIYEGDVVVRHSSICGSIDNIGVVKYDEENAMFVLYCQEKLYATSFHFLKGQTINDGYCTFSETFTYEVIGNIHDTPELLKKN